LALPLALGGCAGDLIVGGLGAAAGGGYTAAQERGVDGAYDDFAVKTEIARAFLKTNPLYQEGITTTVYDRRVLLTGRVHTPEMKQRRTGSQSLFRGYARFTTGSRWRPAKAFGMARKTP
jgi:osmotically-inducible protein OsmY